MEASLIPPQNRFTTRDWVGGRYSLWSTVTLAVAFMLGMEAFDLILDSGHEMDEHSQQFTERFIQDSNLMPRLFPKNWDAKAGKWLAPPAEQPTLGMAFKYFTNRIRTVTADKKTGLVTVHVDWSDPKEAATWANTLVSRANAEMRDRAIKKSEASLAFLERELQGTTQVETRQALNRLIEAQIKQRMLANVSHEYAFRVVDPAIAPDRDDVTKPKKLLIVAAGPVAGLLLAIMTVLTLDWLGVRRDVAPRA